MTLRTTRSDPSSPARRPDIWVKVPEITMAFWGAKLATTAFGEAFSDFVFFNDAIGQHLAIALGLGLLVITLVVQLRTRRYVPVVYWLAVTAVSIFGTMSADFLNKDLGMPLWASTLALLVGQAVVFTLWYRTERSLDVHGIDTARRELFYWATVVLTFALGTAMGDFAADTLGLGSLASSLLFLVLIGLPALAWAKLRVNEVLCFWFAYTVTRPLGASVADWLSVPAPYGDGLQLGTGLMSVLFGVLLVGVVAIMIIRHRRDRQPVTPLPASTR